MKNLLVGFTVALATAALVAPADACPFCSAVSLTLAQEIAQSQAAVIGRLVEPPRRQPSRPPPTARFPRESSPWSRCSRVPIWSPRPA